MRYGVIIDKKRIHVLLLAAICMLYFSTGCGLINGFFSEVSQEQGQVSESGISPVTGNNTSTSGQNIAPVAIMEIYQQNSDSYYIKAGNPVYFTAEKSFDGDGDNLDYSWEISGSGISGSMDFEYVFPDTGIYEVTLTVSDGKTWTLSKKQIEVVEIDDSIIITREHSLTVEIQYTFTNNGPGDVKDLFCLMEVPRTYLPYQMVLDRRSNYGEGDRLIQDEFNVVAQFKLGSLEEGQVKTAYINCDALLCEYEYALIEEAGGYNFGDTDVSRYTGSEYFIDSDSNIIQSAARTATAGLDDPRLKAERLYDLVVNTLEYDNSRIEDGKFGYNHASKILQEGLGVCTDYSVLYTALCRASGIPAIIVQGIPVFSILNQSGQELSYGHAWVEIKLPGYGWIPIDVTSEDEFMGYNFFLNLQTYKGSGVFYRSLEIDGEELYPNGVYYTWMGEREPTITQDISYRIRGLKAEDFDVYKESDFLDRAGLVLNEYNAALNHINSAHGQDWIYNDPEDIGIEETLLDRLKELASSLENIQAPSGSKSGKEELVAISKDIIDAKQRQIDCMKASDYNCNISYNNIFNESISRLFEYFNTLVDEYNKKY